MSDPNQPYQPSYPPPPSQFEPPRQRAGLPGWAIALIVGGVLVTCICIVVPIASIGILTLPGQRTGQVFSQINSGLESAETSTTTPVDTAKAVTVGQLASTSDLSISVTSAKPLTNIKEAFKPSTGREYWVISITVENIASEPVTLSAFSSSIQDNAGVTYPYSFAGERASSQPGFGAVQTLNPGRKISGLLFYEVPQNAKELFWIYKDIIGGGQVAVRVK